MSFYYCIFSVACLEEEKKMSKIVKNFQRNINLSNDGNGRTPPVRGVSKGIRLVMRVSRGVRLVRGVSRGIRLVSGVSRGVRIQLAHRSHPSQVFWGGGFAEGVLESGELDEEEEW